MFVMTRKKNETDEVKDLFITNPRLDIDEIRKIKAMIRFKTKDIIVEHTEEGIEVLDIHTLMKYSRCLGISTIGGALYQMTLRVAGKDEDTIYTVETLYKNGNIELTIKNAYKVDKHLVNI